MNLTYTMQGDYLLPNLEVPESPKVGKYGMLRRSFLRSHKQALYTGMMLEGTILYTGMMLEGTMNSHLEQVDKEANMLLEKLTTQMMQEQGLTEELKSRNQMLWAETRRARRGGCWIGVWR